MATLAADKVRAYGPSAEFNHVPVVANDTVYEGAAVGSSSGNGRPLVAADNFLGFAVRKVVNEPGGAAGADQIQVRRRGTVIIPVTGVTGVGDISKKVYASDDDTFTLTSAGNSLIGYIVRFITGTTVEVEFEQQPI